VLIVWKKAMISPELNTRPVNMAKRLIGLSAMSPDHQVDEQLNLAVLSTFQLILKAFLDWLSS